MKKILLTLIFGIFLISLGSATITFTDSREPLDFNITLVEGGSLVAGTNYTIALSGKTTTSYTSLSRTYFFSDVNVKTITTNSTHKSIRIDSEYDSTFKYLIISYRENSSSPVTLEFDGVLTYSKACTSSTTCSNLTFDNKANYPTGDKNIGNVILQNYDISQEPFPINKSLGTCLITLNGTIPINFGTDDIYTEMVNLNKTEYFKFDGASVNTLCHLYIQAGTNGSDVILDYISYYPYGVGIFAGEVTDINMKFRYSKIYLVPYGWRFSTNNLDLTDAVIEAGYRAGITSEAYMTSTNVYIYTYEKTILSKNKFSGFEVQAYAGSVLNNVVSDSSMRINEMDVSGTKPTKFISCIGAHWWIYVNKNLTGNSTDVYEIRDYSMDSIPSFDLGFYFTPGEIRLYDFKGKKGYSLNADYDKPYIRWELATNPNLTTIKMYHNIKLTLTDSNGNIIEGVNITIKDKDKNILYTNLTNSNGTYQEDILTMNVNYPGTTYGGIYNTLNPLTIEVSKEGYTTYSTIKNITEKTDWTITLEERQWNYDNKILMYIGTLLNSFLKIDAFGNVGIKGNLIENTNVSAYDLLYKFSDKVGITKDGDFVLEGNLTEEVI